MAHRDYRDGVVKAGRIEHELIGAEVLYNEQVWRVVAVHRAPQGTPWLSLKRPWLLESVLVKAHEVAEVRN